MLDFQRLRSLKGIISKKMTTPSLYRTLRKFTPKVSFCIEKGKFTIKTADNWQELEKVLRLRYKVFSREFMNKRFPLGMDADALDVDADHIMILDNKTGKVVGTYRAICSTYSASFYSESEFNIDGLLEKPGVKVELSRACIDPKFRTGAVIHLLWRGIAEVMTHTEADFLFGCGSVQTMDTCLSALAFRWMRENGHVDLRHGIQPVGKYLMPDFAEQLEYLDNNPEEGRDEEGKAMVPPLLAGYFKAGAKVCSHPALDKDYRCVDFLTVLEVNQLSSEHQRKYF